MSEETLKAKLDDLDGVEYERIAGLNGHRYNIDWPPAVGTREVREAAEDAGYEFHPVGSFSAYANPPE